MTKKQYTGWLDIETIQAKEIISELSDAKKHRRAKLLIAETGVGKSHTIKLFQKVQPKNTFVVVVGDSYKLVDVAAAILQRMNIRHKESRVHDMLAIAAEHLQEMANDGAKPIIIIDEAENLKPVSLRMMKELYDAVIDYCSIVLIGTEQILDTIFNKRKRNRQGVPQLWRRFKAGCRDITPLNKARDFKKFFETFIPGAEDVQSLLIEMCENYGELHDYLDPYLVYCSDSKTEPSEDTFRLFHKVPKAGVRSALRKVS